MGEQQRQGERKEKDSLHIDWLVVGQSRSLQSCHCHFAVTLRDQWTRREVCTAIKFFAPSRCKESASPSTKQETKIAACTDRTPQSEDRSPSACIDRTRQRLAT